MLSTYIFSLVGTTVAKVSVMSPFITGKLPNNSMLLNATVEPVWTLSGKALRKPYIRTNKEASKEARINLALNPKP